MTKENKSMNIEYITYTQSNKLIKVIITKICKKVNFIVLLNYYYYCMYYKQMRKKKTNKYKHKMEFIALKIDDKIK